MRSFETFQSRIMSLYTAPPPPRAMHTPPRINLIENQTRIRTNEVTSSVSHDISNLILGTICPAIDMLMRVVYSFSCTIYWGQNQIIEYHKTLSPNGAFMSLNQIEEYVQQCELWLLNLDDKGVWSEVTFPLHE